MKTMILSSLLLMAFCLNAYANYQQPTSKESKSNLCLKRPTLFCSKGYSVRKDDEGCYRCVLLDEQDTPEEGIEEVVNPEPENEPEDQSYHCVKVPAIRCADGYEQAQNSKKCFTCVPKKVNSCIKIPTLTCPKGTFLAKNSQGCYVCSK